MGGCKEALEKLREVVELPLLHPEKFVTLGIDPPKGILLYGPPGTGKTLSARAVANRTDACFIRVIGSELVQKYVGEGARMVRELFQMARSKKACIVFFDEVDAIGAFRRFRCCQIDVSFWSEAWPYSRKNKLMHGRSSSVICPRFRHSHSAAVACAAFGMALKVCKMLSFHFFM